MRKLILIMGIFSALFGGKAKAQSTDEKYKPVLNDLNTEQIEFIKNKSKQASEFVAKYSEFKKESIMEFQYLDTSIENWKNADQKSREKTEDVIDMIGALFGQTLSKKLNFEWQLITDQYGTDFTVIDKKYFVNGFPFSSVQKSVLEYRPNALSEIYELIKEQLKKAKESGEVDERN
ncbi:DUF3806 domain-containing protein [Cellulophaga lytica]|uniref:DUF3806 domain-containing protein n=1 Tax=Cellulophaga TaxID=104264 RepID=UPI0011A5D7D1|nr:MULTISPECIES: DUF3806 domain-containing protein [Cellulophaga]MDO6852105.1 DUF3806 domain-containing protein [Cellulophaga lytica]